LKIPGANPAGIDAKAHAPGAERFSTRIPLLFAEEAGKKTQLPGCDPKKRDAGPLDVARGPRKTPRKTFVGEAPGQRLRRLPTVGMVDAYPIAELV
jgi:hypothetical protein